MLWLSACTCFSSSCSTCTLAAAASCCWLLLLLLWNAPPSAAGLTTAEAESVRVAAVARPCVMPYCAQTTQQHGSDT
jgi:hypothetical protein